MRRACALMLVLGSWFSATALDPRKALSQYSRTLWTQQHGLPQDTVRAITQTRDGYLWVGTDEGLARFDGYEFSRFSRDQGQLPSNSVAALATGTDGSLWIGTPNGLTQFRNQRFRTFTSKDGLPDNAVTALLMDHDGVLWIVAGGNLVRMEAEHFATIAPAQDVDLGAVRAITEDSRNNLYAVGYNLVVKVEKGVLVPFAKPPLEEGALPVAIQVDRADNLWVLSTRGLIRRSSSGQNTKFGPQQGLPNALGLGDLWEDRDGNLWVGSGNRLARLENGQIRTAASEGGPTDSIRCIFEDREGNLWIGSSDGLARVRDDVFTVYGTPEGFPSDEPNAIYQDRRGRIWAGFLDRGVAVVADGKAQPPPNSASMPTSRVFSFNETRAGQVLISSGQGLTRWQDGHVTTFVPPDPLGRKYVYDALEDSHGRIWLALPSGLAELKGNDVRIVIPGGQLLDESIVTLEAGLDDTLWAASHKALWRVRGGQPELIAKPDRLGFGQVRSLYQEHDGTLWIGTFGGGLSALRNGEFLHYTAQDGLLSNNISKVIDDGVSLWLSTTRGICQISKQELRDFSEHRIKTLHPINYGVADGLRSAQYSPTAGAGGSRHADGSLWFATARGIAVYQSQTPQQELPPPAVYFVDMSLEGRPVDTAGVPQLPPGSGPLQIRYTAIHLSAPDRIQYSYKLEGLDSDWTIAGDRRVVNYTTLPHGRYTLRVKAELPRGPASEAVTEFELLPHFYESAGFRLLGALALVGFGWMIYRLRERQVRTRFAMVLEERARLAREVHDTLAQGFVGISSQLDAVSMCMPDDAGVARTSLDMARRMARHSLTEARRSVMDLRAAALDDQSLAAAIESGVRDWTAGSGVEVEVNARGDSTAIPEHVAHHVLRIAQEAVTNALKHGVPGKIEIKLDVAQHQLRLTVSDDGRGFEPEHAFVSMRGHFGLIGMRERAERLGGDLQLKSYSGKGSCVEVRIPLR